MGVRFACHACQRRLNIKSDLAGKKGKCPSCGTRFRIPDHDSDFSIPLTSDRETQDSGQGATSEPSHEPLANRQPAESEQPEPEQPEPASSAPEPTKAEDSSPAAADRQTEPAVPPPPAPPRASAPSDLLDADPSAMWYVRPPSGGQYGPATGRLLKEWIGEGRVAAASLLWRDGWAQWRRAEEVVPSLVTSQEASTAAQSPGEPISPVTAATAAVVHAASDASAPHEELVAPANQPTPPGQIKRRRKIRRVTMIGILVGLSILLLIVLIFVIISGLGE